MAVIFLIPVAIFLVVLAFIVFFQFVSLTINYFNVILDAPDWVATSNFWAWLVFSLLLMVSLGILKIISRGIWNVITAIFNIFMGLITGSRWNPIVGYIIVRITLAIVGIVLTSITTGLIFQFGTDNPNLTEYFNNDNWVGKILVWLNILGIYLPFNKKNHNKEVTLYKTRNNNKFSLYI